MNDLQTKDIKSGQIFRYTLLPEFLPRLANLFGAGFRTLAFYIASIFGTVRIFPRTHPYLQSVNYQKFGVVSVLAEGSRCVTWSRKHIDQVLIYLIILSGFITLLVQFILMGMTIFTGNAFAGGFITSSDDFDFFFTPSAPEQDYALRFLDLVFGLENLAGTSGYFESCIGSSVTCQDYEGNPLPPYPAFPTAMHTGFHSMIAFYNYTIIGLTFVLFMYYFITLAAETTVHGTFWGQRANKTWLPVRVVFFAALIMPFYQGFNLAQIVTLNAAYFGTGMASNIWREVNSIVNNELAGQHQNLVAPPNRRNFPSSTGFVEYMSIVKTCQFSEQRINRRIIDAYIVKDTIGGIENCLPLAGTSYADALEFSNNENIRIRFGERVRYPENDPRYGAPIPCSDPAASYNDMGQDYATESGYVIPYCGEVTLTASGPRVSGELIREGHYQDLVQNLWSSATIENIGEGYTETGLNRTTPYSLPINTLRMLVDQRDAAIETNIVNAVNLLTTGHFDIAASVGACGWMCAALYYNRIADANGEVQSSIFTMPDITLWPAVTEVVLDHRAQENINTQACDMFNPTLPGRRVIDFSEESNLKVASIISTAHEDLCDNEFLHSDFSDGGTDSFRYTMTSMGDNPVLDTISLIFGINGLFDMREHVDVHPLAQLSLLGRGMIESTIRAFGLATVGTMGTVFGIEDIVGAAGAGALSATTGVLTTFGIIGMTIGFILFYVLPFLPFVYFIFAAAGWMKAIFEGMVGLPLWAVAHLRLDGEGIIGDAAASGYWLILEILIRPFLILTGLLVSVSIFMALVKVLNDSFDVVVANVGGYNAADAVMEADGSAPATNPDPFTLKTYRNPIDQFFYTVIYAIIVYMIAMSTFKLVDIIPNQILRWAGEGVKTFGDFSGDPASELMGYVGKGVTLTAVLGGGLLGKVGDRNASPLSSGTFSGDEPESS